MDNTLYTKEGVIKTRDKIVITGTTQVQNEEGETVEMPFSIYNPTPEQLTADGWEIYVKPEPTLEEVRATKLHQLTLYDKSTEVNAFLLNGNSVWLPKEDRVGLMNSINIEQAAGRTESNLWFNGIKLVVNITQAIQLLSALELYALDCYNVTAAHQAAIKALETTDAIKAYDFTIGYPEKLQINI